MEEWLEVSSSQEVWTKPLQLLYSTLVCTLAPFFVEKTMSYVILEDDRLCRFLTKKAQKNLRCQIDFLIICNFFCSNHFLIRCQTKILLQRIHVCLKPKWKNQGSRVPNLFVSTASHPTYYNLPYAFLYLILMHLIFFPTFLIGILSRKQTDGNGILKVCRYHFQVLHKNMRLLAELQPIRQKRQQEVKYSVAICFCNKIPTGDVPFFRIHFGSTSLKFMQNRDCQVGMSRFQHFLFPNE